MLVKNYCWQSRVIVVYKPEDSSPTNLAGILDKLQEILHELKDLKKLKENKSTIKKEIQKEDKRVCTKWNSIAHSSNEFKC